MAGRKSYCIVSLASRNGTVVLVDRHGSLRSASRVILVARALPLATARTGSTLTVARRPFAAYGKLSPTVNELRRSTRSARISLSIFVTFHHDVSVAYEIPFGR